MAIWSSDDPVRPYRLDPKLLFETLRSDWHTHRDTLPAMIQRYGIVGKKVLSVGPGDCAQEYWFHAAGNSLFLVDIDEGGVIEPGLREMASKAPPPEDRTTYIVGDARHVSEWLDTKFDVIFTSSLTPDEFYRRDQQADFAKVLAAADPALSVVGSWPPAKSPISPLCAEIIERGLADGGLFVMLSYASGPDILYARNYLPCLADGLPALGLTLIETHYLASAPGVHLVVALKTSDTKLAQRTIERLRAEPPLTAIHARTELELRALRVIGRTVDMAAEHLPAFADSELGAHLPLIARHIEPWLQRFAPDARTAFYCGENPATEGRYLLARGMAVDMGWGADFAVPPAALERGLVHRTQQRTVPSSPFDLCFLSMPGRDERVRARARESIADETLPLFDAETLAFVSAILAPNGTLFYIGRSDGIDLTYTTSYGERIARALAVAGLSLRELYVLRELPSIFAFAAAPSAAPATLARAGEPIDWPFCHVLADQPSRRIWPPAA